MESSQELFASQPFLPRKPNYSMGKISKSPKLSTAVECDEEHFEQFASDRNSFLSTGRLFSEEIEGDSCSSSTTATRFTSDTNSNTSSSERMGNGERIPRLSVGPYQQRPVPVLVDNSIITNFLNIPPPNCPPPPSALTEMRGPPPLRNPPVPPVQKVESTFATRFDDSQYDEPGLAPEFKGHFQGGFKPYELSERTDSRSGPVNSYEISTSQIRSSKGLDSVGMDTTEREKFWGDETRQMLVQNPDTGSFYVPTSSGHTTTTSLSPHNRFYELTLNPSAGKANVITKVKGQNLRYGSKNFIKDASVDNRFELKKSKSFEKNSNMERKRMGAFCSWKAVALCLFLALIFTCLIIIFLLVSREQTRRVYVHTTRSVYQSKGFKSESQHHPKTDFSPLIALPESFELGQEVEGELPAGVIVYTKFSVQRDSRISFNYFVGPRAQFVVYGRQTAPPSPTANDFTDIIRFDRLHISTSNSTDVKIRKRSLPTSLYRSAIFNHYLLAGRWHLAFLNDGQYPEFVRFLASTSNDEISVDENKDCQSDCSGRGACEDGKCICFPGYSGNFCEENSCPVLCSGNGVFSAGRCICHEGYKGTDCDQLSHWCEIPNCNEHGICNQNGNCECDQGWKGEFCDEKDCLDSQCGGFGVCLNGSCLCQNGYNGMNCEKNEQVQETCITQRIPQQEKLVLLDKNISPTTMHPMCNNRGRLDSETKECQCMENFHGEYCQFKPCQFECMHGFCGDGNCICDLGWAGPVCNERRCLPGCEEKGFCSNGTCVCQKGWNGENCHIDGCGDNCNGNGLCQLFDNQWNCACKALYSGEKCNIAVERDCDDRIDNDNDGLVDCEDSECCAHKSCVLSQMCVTVAQPKDVLLKLLPSINSNFYQQVKFLIQANSIQQYADEKQFNESLVSVIRGRVITEEGSPLIGVRVAESRHPPLSGFTLSRSENGGGFFDLLVNGGRVVILEFMRKPFEKTEQSFYVPWNEIVYVGDVKMRIGPTTVNKFTTEADEKCRSIEGTHRIHPDLFPLWHVNQYSGLLSSSVESCSQLLADSRKIFESLLIPGTSNIYLVYDSSRADKYQSILLIELLQGVIPDNLRLVHVKIFIAGNYFKKTFSAQSNLTHTFAWDQSNAYEQTVNGLINAKVSVGYEYAGCEKNIVWRHRLVRLEGRKANRFNLGSWSINIHHHYDVINNILEKGDGSKVYLDEAPKILTQVVGGDQQRPLACPFCNELVNTARLFRPEALCVGSDGSLYIGDYNLIRKSTASGQLITVLELSVSDTAHPYYMAINPQTDVLYISLPLRRQIWSVNNRREGTSDEPNYNVVVGDGNICADNTGRCGDGGSADMAQLIFPKGLAFDLEGNLYFADSRRIRVVDKNNKISTLIPNWYYGPRACVADNIKFDELKLEWPTSLIFDMQAKDLLILDSNIIYRISLRSRLANIVIGNFIECEQLKRKDGTTVQFRLLTSAKSIAISPDSTIYIVETDNKQLNRVRALTPDGRLEVSVGCSSKCDCDRTNCPCESMVPTIGPASFLHSPSAVAVDQQGTLYIADQGNFKVKRLQKVQAIYNNITRQYRINSAHTNEIYYFNKNGLHISTRNLLSGFEIYNFTYNVDTNLGRLTQISGTGGHSIRIRSYNDTETIIEPPFSQRTVLSFDSFDRTLISVNLPAIGTVRYTYLPGQFLQSKQVNRRMWWFEYDEYGRATSLVNPSGLQTSVVDQRFEKGRLLTTVYYGGTYHSVFSYSPNEFIERSSGIRRALIQTDGILIQSEGIKTYFDGVSHPLLDLHENAILKRKIILSAIDTPSRRELSMRFEWRGYVRRKNLSGSRSGGSETMEMTRRQLQVGRRPRINGRNVFAIEFDRDYRVDIIRNSIDEEILSIEYNEAGQVRNVKPLGTFRFASMNSIFDVHGRCKKIIWGDLSTEVTYDRRSRIIQLAIGPSNSPLRRKFQYGKDYAISVVELAAGEKYRWDYDAQGRVENLKTPSGDTHYFRTYLGFDRMIIARQPAYTNTSFLTSTDDDGRILEYSTPDGSHSLVIQRDQFGRITSLVADTEIIEFSYSKVNRLKQPIEINSFAVRRKIVYQGVLPVHIREVHSAVLYFNRRFPESTVSFLYEYDDLFRVVSVLGSIDERDLEQMRYEYDDRFGRLVKIQNFAILRDANIRRVLGNNILIESLYNDMSEEKVKRFMVGDRVIAEMIVDYHVLGWKETAYWTILGEKRPSERRIFSINGQLTQLTIGEAENHRWTLHYDLDGRLKALNNEKLLLGTGGVPISFGQYSYVIDANGWTIKRGETSLNFDVFGRVTKVFHPEKIDIEYGYDEKSRIIWRRVGENVVQRFFYALPHRPRRITHFTISNDKSVWSILYDDEDHPILLNHSSTYYLIVTDVDNSFRFIFDSDGALVKEVIRNPLGMVVSDTNPSLFIPLGYLSQFDDPLAGLVIMGEQARPYDTVIGRFMTTPVSFMSSPVNVIIPEYEGDPFRPKVIPTNSIRKFPTDIGEWMQKLGFHFTHSLPSLALGYLEKDDFVTQLTDSPAELCDTSTAHSVSAAFCSLMGKTVHFKQFLTVSDSGLLPSSILPTSFPIYRVPYAYTGDTNKNAFLFKKNSEGLIFALSSAVDRSGVVNLLNSILSNSTFVPTNDIGLLPMNTGIYAEMHFCTKSVFLDEAHYEDLKSFFTIMSKDSRLVLHIDNNSRIIIHFGVELDQVLAQLLHRRKEQMEALIWTSESKAVRAGAIARNKWTQNEITELISNGLVTNYQLTFRPNHLTAVWSNQNLWFFDRLKL